MDNRYLDKRIETMPRPELEALQEMKLIASLARSVSQAPLIDAAWRAAGVSPGDIRSIADFKAKAPFIRKDDIRDYREATGDATGGLSTAVAPQLRGMGFSSGTSGDPTPTPRGTRLPYDLTFQRELWEIGIRPGDYICRIMMTFRYGISLSRFIALGMKPITFEFNPRELPRLFEASLRYRPTMLTNLSNGMITAMEAEFERLELDPREVLASYRGAMVGGEPIGAHQRALCAAWGVELFESTALGDIVGAVECRAHDGFHAWEDFALVESLDPDGDQPVADGAIGELVVTALSRDVTALIRFRTDDLVIVDRSRCSCGRTHARFRLLGRKGDQLLVGGRSIMPLDVWPHVQAQPECIAGLFQLIRPQREMDRLHVRVGYDGTRLHGSRAELEGRIANALSTALGVPAIVEAVDNDALLRLGPPHKIPRVSKS